MNKRILIVDDETNVRLNFRMTLETEGYEIFEARSAEQAVEVLAEHSFALVILDMRMPGMDGLELLAKMRESGIGAPVMIVTAYTDVPHAVKAMKLGAIDFLQKPLRPEDFRNIVAEIIKRPRSTGLPTGHSVFDSAIILPAIGEAFRKLNPVTLAENPVMFVTEVGAAISTILLDWNPFSREGRPPCRPTNHFWFRIAWRKMGRHRGRPSLK
jgi:DNA-binding NtrC family response regulator